MPIKEIIEICLMLYEYCTTTTSLQQDVGDRVVDAINDANTVFSRDYVCELSAALCTCTV